MSRIGKLPIPVPPPVKVKVDGARIFVEGPKGKLDMRVDDSMAIEIRDGQVVVTRKDKARQTRSIHGLTRKLLANMIHGVSQGFSQVLEINGVGYRAEVKGNLIQLLLGYSHPIVFQLPAGVSAKVEKQTVITLEGADRQILGETAAMIRGLRPPEPYKGKGVKYAEETIRRKAGKAAGTAGAG
ncbi:MAG TPA: 50S ribosomal protein L6 [Candidatus Binatia bacterium]|nr:50S ribosomal protein L6 [Candidatus Binatia bacterium]